MSRPFLSYLEREHERLEQELTTLLQQRFPDPLQVARLKKLKLAMRDQISLALPQGAFARAA